MGEEEREGLVALRSASFRGSEPCRSRHEAHPSKEAGSGWLQPLVGAAKCESEQPEQRKTCQAAMAGGNAPRQKRGLRGPSSILHARISQAVLPAATLQLPWADGERAPRAQGPTAKPRVPFLGTRHRGAEGGQTRCNPARRFCSPAPGGAPRRPPPARWTRQRGDAPTTRNPLLAAGALSTPFPAAARTFRNSQ